MPLPALIVPLPVITFPNKVAPNVPNNVLNILNVFLLMPFINKLNSSIDLTILILSFISSFEIINGVTPDQNIC